MPYHHYYHYHHYNHYYHFYQYHHYYAFEKILTTSTFPLHFKSEILSEKLPENIVYATMHVQLLIFRHY